MIGKLTGTLGEMSQDGTTLIEVNGVGYVVRTTKTTMESLHRGAFNQVSLFIHTSVREDAIDLYGFLTKDEHSFFKQLTSVSGIGPKSALGILNVSDVDTLKQSIARGDASALTKVFGIGKKSAERVVVELRDKLIEAKDSSDIHGNDAEVIEALMSLGYRAEEARHVVQILMRDGTTHILNTPERVAAALKLLGTRVTP